MNWTILPHGKGRLLASFLIAVAIVTLVIGLGFAIYGLVLLFGEDAILIGFLSLFGLAFLTGMVYTYPN